MSRGTPALVEFLLFAAPGLPVLLALAWPVRPLRRWVTAGAPWAALPALVLALLQAWGPGTEASVAWSGFSTGLHLAVDPVGGAFLLLTALLWAVAGLYARSYHADDPGRDRFFGFFVLTLAGNLGVVLAGDLLTFYLSFAWMTFAAYGLVVHRGDATAQRAGRVYIILALVGEAALLAGLFALGAAHGGSPGFGPPLAEAWGALAGASPGGSGATALPGTVPILGSAPVVAALLAAGFSVKAGLTPLHLWLPLAHPVAPTAASALLSGVMLKAGLLGWIRVLPGELVLPGLGTFLLAVGTFTAFYGVIVGVAQDDPKTVLAYSSVSQMGYAGIGTGVFLLLPPEMAPVALAAVAVMAVHHGLAKGALFLSVGVAGRLPGGRSRTPWRRGTLAGAAFSSLALAGAPFTAGAMAKAGLKEALGSLGGAWYAALDPLLLAAAAGTTLVMARFLVTLARAMAEGCGGAGADGKAEVDRDGEGANVAIRAQQEGEAKEGAGADGEAPPPWGIALPWGALLLAGVTAPLWFPLALALPGESPVPSPASAILASILPVAAGALLATAVLRRPGILGGLRRVRIPPGDLVVLAERAAGAVRRPGLGWARKFADRWRARGSRLLEGFAAELDRWNGGDILWMRGTWLGTILLGMAVALLVALSG